MPLTSLDIRTHQENHILVTFYVDTDFERGNRPQFEFDVETGVLYLTQEPYNGRVTASSEMNFSFDGIMSGQINIRNTENLNHNNRQILVDGRPAAGVDLSTIEGITFVDTGVVVIYFPERFAIATIRFDSRNTTMKIFGENNLTIRNIYANTINGAINLIDVYLHDINLTATNGSLSLANAVIDGNISITTSNGSINVLDSQALSPFHAQSSNGSVRIRNSRFTQNLTTEVSNGTVNWDNITAEQNAFARASNGTVTLSNSRIDGQLFSRASNGTIRLSNIDTNMNAADIESGRNGRVFIDGILQR